MAAPSLVAELSPIVKAFERAHPETEVRVEWVGSVLACRQVKQGDKPVDVLVAADAELVRTMLAPSLLTSHRVLMTDALVLAFPRNGGVAETLAAGQPWQSALLGRRIGYANPATAPLGYRTMMALGLNDRVVPQALQLGGQVRAALRPEDQRADAAQVAALVETGAVDAAFLYRKEARSHGFGVHELDPAVNFGDATRGTWYASASMPLSDGSGVVVGSAVQYSIATLASASEAALAREFADFVVAAMPER